MSRPLACREDSSANASLMPGKYESLRRVLVEVQVIPEYGDRRRWAEPHQLVAGLDLGLGGQAEGGLDDGRHGGLFGLSLFSSQVARTVNYFWYNCAPAFTPPWPPGSLESNPVACPSGRRSTPRKRVTSQDVRGFKSHRHRQLLETKPQVTDVRGCRQLSFWTPVVTKWSQEFREPGSLGVRSGLPRDLAAARSAVEQR